MLSRGKEMKTHSYVSASTVDSRLVGRRFALETPKEALGPPNEAGTKAVVAAAEARRNRALVENFIVVWAGRKGSSKDVGVDV
jgi:hypothetical protein